MTKLISCFFFFFDDTRTHVLVQLMRQSLIMS